MEKLIDKQTAKFISRIAENLPSELTGDMMQGWSDNPLGLQKVLKDALCPPENVPIFKIWKTIKLGTGLKTADDFRKKIKKSGMKIGDWANDILGKPAFTAATEKIEVDLVVISVGELGFKDGVKRENIYAQAKKLGLQLCLNEVGPQLRLQYKDQPNGEWLVIAMEPITGSDGFLGLFRVERDGNGQWLRSYYGNPDGVWPASGRFVFVLPRK